MPDGLAGFYSDGDIPQDSTLCDNPVNRGEGLRCCEGLYSCQLHEFIVYRH